jgi:hypothetical protein
VPATVDISRSEFLQHREAWKLYRSLGHYQDGAWVPPISFLEAVTLPKAMLDVFQELDHFLSQMQKHQMKKQGKKPPKG